MNQVQELFNQFHEIATSPESQLKKYLENGQKVVACVPVYTPEELVHAMGMVPMGAWGADIELKDAKRFFPSFICSIAQSIIELGIQGAYNGISAIMIPSLCDSLKCLGENWKYAVPSIPFIAADYPQNRKMEAGHQYVIATYKKQIKKLEEISGTTFEECRLRKTIEIYNEHNLVMRQVSKMFAKHPSITAVQRSDVFKSALFMKKEDHTSMVKNLMILLENVVETDERLRIMTTGIQLDNESMLKLFDENGMQVVVDDVAQESRQYRTDIPDVQDPIDALSMKFCNMNCCSVLYDVEKKRIKMIVEQARENKVDGIVYIQTKFCDPEEFDYVPMKKACEEAGIPLLMIEVDRQMNNFEQARTALQTFSEVLKSK